MIKSEHKNGKIILCGVGVSLFIFLIGFFVMLIFWMNDIQNPNIPGFFSYKAATYGDGICLPILIGCLTMYILFGFNNINEYIKQRKRTSIVIGVICASIGALVQVSWLISKATKPNWTIPRLHHFTAAGWYHAFYFSFMFGLIGFLMSELWIYKSKTQEKQSFEQTVCLMGIFVSGICYMYLHAIDDWVNIYGKEFSFLLTFVGMISVLAIFCATANRGVQLLEDLKILLLSSCFSFGFVFIISENTNINLYYIILSMIAALFFSSLEAPAISNPKKSIWNICVLIISIFVMYLSLFSNFHLGIKTLIFTFIINVFLWGIYSINSLLIESRQGKHIFIQLVLEFLVPAYIALLLLFDYFQANYYMIRELNEFLNLFINGLFGIITMKVVKRYISSIFALVKNNEYMGEGDNSKTKESVYFNIVLVGLGAYLYYFIGVILSVDNFGEKVYLNVNKNDLIFTGIFLLVIILLFLNSVFKDKGKRIRALCVLIVSYMLLIILQLNNWSFPKFNLAFVCLIFSCPASALMVAVGYYNNLNGLHGEVGDFIDKLSAVVIGLGGVLCAFIACINIASTESSNEEKVINLLLNIIQICMGYVLLPYLSGKNLKGKEFEGKLIKNTITSGILQDGFTSVIIICLAGIYPVYYGERITSTMKMSNWLLNLVLMIMLIVLFALLIAVQINWPFIYCLENNKEHLTKMCEKYENLVKMEEENIDIYRLQIETLLRHIKFQNRFAYISTIPYLPFYDLCNRFIGGKTCFSYIVVEKVSLENINIKGKE